MSVKGPYHHVHLVSHDPRATAEWYTRNLDGRISLEANLRGSLWVRIQLGEARLNIRAPRPGETIVAPSEGSHIGIDHFALSVDDFEQMAERFAANGVTIVEPMFTTPFGGRALFIEGPDKVLIEIMDGALPSA